MSHCNITMRDRFSAEEVLRDRVAHLQAMNQRLELLLESIESNLRSVFERVKSGDDVYLCYPDGSTIHIVARTDPPEAA